MTTFNFLDRIVNGAGTTIHRMVVPFAFGQYQHARVGMQSRVASNTNMIVRGDGIGATSLDGASGSTAGVGKFETIDKPYPSDPDTFPALLAHIGNNLMQFLCTHPALATYARTYYGTDATFGAQTATATKIVYPKTLIDSEGFTGDGFIEDAALIVFGGNYYNETDFSGGVSG